MLTRYVNQRAALTLSRQSARSSLQSIRVASTTSSTLAPPTTCSSSSSSSKDSAFPSTTSTYQTRTPQSGSRHFGSEAATSLLKKMGYGDVELTAGQVIAIQELVAATNLTQDELNSLSSEKKRKVFNEEFLIELSEDPMDGAGLVIDNAITRANQIVSAPSLLSEKSTLSPETSSSITTPTTPQNIELDSTSSGESRHEYVKKVRSGEWAAPERSSEYIKANPAETPLRPEQIERIADFYHTIHGHPELNATTKAHHFLENNSYKEAVGLYGRQVADEVNDTFAAIYDYMDDSLEKFETNAMGHSGIKKYQKLWWNNVLPHIENEQENIINCIPDIDRAIYGPVFACLPAEQLAVIVVHSTLDQLLRHNNNEVKFVQLANNLGRTVIDMIRTRDLMKNKRSREAWAKSQCGLTTLKGAPLKQIRIYEKVRSIILGKVEIGPRVSVKIGAALLNKLMQSAKVENPDRRGNFFLVDVF
jgi:hypothetical protein